MKSAVAVVGTGSAGMRHMNALRGIAGVRAIAVPRRRERIGELKSLGYDVAASFEEAVEMGAKSCVIATDTRDHCRDSVRAFEGGMDVLVEKPLTAAPTEANDLILQARACDRRIFVGCPLRFSKSLAAFREALPRAGALHSVRIECRSYLPDWRPLRPYATSYSARDADGGVLLDLIHEVDYAAWLFGWPQTVFARVRNFGRLGIESCELAELAWESPGGAMITIALDYLTRPARRGMQVFGESGTIAWDALAGSVAISQPSDAATVVASPDTADDMFRAQDAAFVFGPHAPELPLATGLEGARAVAICDAARRSAESRRHETINYPRYD